MTSKQTPSFVDSNKNSTKFNRTWITGYLASEYSVPKPFVVSLIPPYDVFDIMPSRTTCMYSLIPNWVDSEKNRPSLKKLQLTTSQLLPVSYVFLRSVIHYFPDNRILIWCPLFWLFQTSDSTNLFRIFRLLVLLCPKHSYLNV